MCTASTFFSPTKTAIFVFFDQRNDYARLCGKPALAGDGA